MLDLSSARGSRLLEWRVAGDAAIDVGRRHHRRRCLDGQRGLADGSGLVDVHREKFKECLGFPTYQDFDAAWAAWVQANYASQ